MQINRLSGCTIFGIKNNNQTFIGRNYDWSPNANRFFNIFQEETKNLNKYLAVTDMYVLPESKHPYFFDPDDALNEHGIYIGLTYAYDEKASTGIRPTHMISHISETCSTVNDALKIFKTTPLAFPKNFFIADKSGDMVVVEHTSEKFKVIKPKNNILIHTNNYLNLKLAKEDTVLKEKPESYIYIKYYETLQALNKSKKNIRIQ